MDLIVSITLPVKDHPQGLSPESLKQCKRLWLCSDIHHQLLSSCSLSFFSGSVCYHDNHGSQQVNFETKWKRAWWLGINVFWTSNCNLAGTELTHRAWNLNPNQYCGALIAQTGWSVLLHSHLFTRGTASNSMLTGTLHSYVPLPNRSLLF